MISFAAYFPETSILGSLNTKALLPERERLPFADCVMFFSLFVFAVHREVIKMASVFSPM